MPPDDGLDTTFKIVLQVEATQKLLLEQEDLDNDGLITIQDRGPKVHTINKPISTVKAR